MVIVIYNSMINTDEKNMAGTKQKMGTIKYSHGMRTLKGTNSAIGLINGFPMRL